MEYKLQNLSDVYAKVTIAGVDYKIDPCDVGAFVYQMQDLKYGFYIGHIPLKCGGEGKFKAAIKKLLAENAK